MATPHRLPLKAPIVLSTFGARHVSRTLPKAKRMRKTPAPKGIKPGPGALIEPMPKFEEATQKTTPMRTRKKLGKMILLLFVHLSRIP